MHGILSLVKNLLCACPSQIPRYSGLEYQSYYFALLKKLSNTLPARELTDRLAKFGLELSAEKTRIVEFGRYARKNSRKNGHKPGSFTFLGFTHFCDKSRNGYFKVGSKTDRKKFSVKIKDLQIFYNCLWGIRFLCKPR